MVLGRGDDFFASDSTGKVENKAAAGEQLHHHRQPSLDRNTTTSPTDDSPTIKPIDRASRRRSRTISMIGPPSAFRLNTQSISPIIESHSPTTADSTAATPAKPTTTPRPPSTSSSSSASLSAAPLLFTRHHRDWKRRPRSIAFGEGDNHALDRSPPPPRKPRGATPTSNPSGACRHCNCHASPPPPPPPSKPPTYVDASMQTDPPPPPPRGRKRYHYYSDDDEDAEYDDDENSSSAPSLSSRSRRSSGSGSAAATDITTPSTHGVQGAGNPVVMGKMQSYFRSTGYQLGDALRPSWGLGQGLGLGLMVGQGEDRVEVPGQLRRAWSEVLDRRRTV